MMDLYTIEQQSRRDGADVLRLRLNKDSAVYRAHFPGHPITPGAMMIEMGRELLCLLTGRKMEITEVVSAKFLNVLSPVDNPEVEYVFLSIEATGEGVKARMQLRWQQTLFATIQIIANEEY